MLQKQKSLWRGIRRHGTGWQIAVRVKGHPPFYEMFPITAERAEMQARRRSVKDELKGLKPAATAGTFARDAANYLTTRATMPTIDERRRHIGLWVKEFGARHRASIKPWEIAQVRERWLTDGPRIVTVKGGTQKQPKLVEVKGPLSASQVNQRLRALENLYTVLDGRRADNPVREVAEVDPPDGGARGLPYDVVEAILAQLPDRGRPDGSGKRPPVSLTKLRLRAIAYTGLSHGELRRVGRTDLHLDDSAPWVWIAGRRKGKGTKGVAQPLTPEGAAALRSLAAAKGGLGTFTRSSMWRTFQRACAKLDLTGVRPYDLRHSFASEVLDKTKNLGATQLLMRHSSQKTMLRYAERAVDPMRAAAIEQVRKAGGFAPRNAPDDARPTE